MIRFCYEQYSYIEVSGCISLRAERAFRLIGATHLEIPLGFDKSLSILNSQSKCEVIQNSTGLSVEIISDSEFLIDCYKIKVLVRKDYLFHKKYGHVLVNDEIFGEILITKRLLKFELVFNPRKPEHEVHLLTEPIAIAILINTLNIDGSF